MDRINISSNSSFEDSIGFSRAVKTADHIYVAGTAPITTPGSGEEGHDDTYNQTRTCLRIMKKAIEDAGGEWQNVVRTRIYLKNAAEWEAAAKAHREFFSDIRPACTFLEVKGFINPKWLVETEADCIL